MAKSYQQIVEQIESLKSEAARLRAAEIKGVIDRIRSAIDTYGLTKEDLGFGAPKERAPRTEAAKPARGGRRKAAATKPTGRTIPPKYRDQNGNTWTGRGLKPRWLTAALNEGKKIEDFVI